jgi:tetratricopeptide (TPR) repeat protein
MRKKLIFAILILSATLAGAQEKMTDQLRKAIVEEEANQNLDKAIQAYQSILAQFDQERQTAATALFHLADCYRKQGKTAQAISAYKRMVQEFPDQAKLADASRNYLSKTYGLNQGQISPAETKQVAEARRRYRVLLEQEIELVQVQLAQMEKQFEVGLLSRGAPEVMAAREKLLELQRTLAAFDAGALPIPQISIK